MSTATKEKITLRMERIIAATPERLFALWTEPEELIKWWGPEGYTTPKHAMDVRPGGRWRTTMRSPDGKDHTVSGIYRTLEPPRRLVFTWGWDDDAGAARPRDRSHGDVRADHRRHAHGAAAAGLRRRGQPRAPRAWLGFELRVPGA